MRIMQLHMRIVVDIITVETARFIMLSPCSGKKLPGEYVDMLTHGYPFVKQKIQQKPEKTGKKHFSRIAVAVRESDLPAGPVADLQMCRCLGVFGGSQGP